MARLKELSATPRSDWHAGFEALLRIDMHKYADLVRIDTECEIGIFPPRTDFMIVVGDEKIVWDKAIFKSFRQFNVVEYKNPNDSLNERVIRKAVGYAELYIGTAEHDGERPADQVTISIFRYSKNEELFKQLEEAGRLVSDEVRGIYHVTGYADLPLQIIITGELQGDEYAACRALTDKANEADVERVVEWGDEEDDDVLRDYYRTVIRLVITKNPHLEEMIRKDKEMEDKLMDILKDRIDERVSEAVNEAVSDASVNHITAVMSELGCTPERAMDLLHIPESERPTYVGLMEERKQ